MHFMERFTILFLILTLMTGCAGTTDLFAYAEGAAEFTLVFPSVSGDADAIVCACSRDDPGNFTLTVTDPARLRGFTVEIRDGNAACGMAETKIPLSHDAAEGLIRLLTTLTEEGSVKKSPDGTATIITTPTGEITLDDAMMPIEVKSGTVRAGVRGFGGVNREERIENR